MKLLQKSMAGMLMLMLYCGTLQAQTKNTYGKNEKAAICKKAIQLLHENYIYPERVPDIEKFVYGKMNSGGYDSINNAGDFLDALNQDLERTGHDHHLDISYGPERVRQIISDNKNEEAGREEKLTNEWLQMIRYENFRMRKLERLDGNIGYFSFLNFTPLSVTKQSISAAMNFLLYSNAIIIDLRENGGGYAETMNYLLGYFLADGILLSELRYRKGNRIEKRFVKKDSLVNKIPDSIALYILVSNRTSSAAEGFTYILQQNKRATIIGERTKGEGNPGSLFVIDDNLYIMIPTAEAINHPSKRSIDGIGVTPDISINKNKALSSALATAYAELAAKAGSKERKLFYEWQVPFFENEVSPEPLTEKIISALVGDYEEGRKIVNEAGALFYVNSKGEKEKLNYIGKGLFQPAGKKGIRLKMPFTDKPVPFVEWNWDDGGKPQVVKRVSK